MSSKENKTEEIRKVDCIIPEEQAIEDYRDYLYKLAIGDRKGIITNSGVPHASLLMGTLISNTRNSLKMYCTGLRPGILDEANGAYWNEFQKFFDETVESFEDHKVQILVQKNEWIQGKPFKHVWEAKNKNSNKIDVRMVTEEGKKYIEDKFGGLGDNEKYNYNFSVFDNIAFRLEYKPDDYKAIASFRNESWSTELSKIFDEVFNEPTLSRELTGQN